MELLLTLRNGMEMYLTILGSDVTVATPAVREDVFDKISFFPICDQEVYIQRTPLSTYPTMKDYLDMLQREDRLYHVWEIKPIPTKDVYDVLLASGRWDSKDPDDTTDYLEVLFPPSDPVTDMHQMEWTGNTIVVAGRDSKYYYLLTWEGS
ncbi:hypothetical protein KIPB_002377 [Kipferlia bialata]|uniref:Uncharacterized protein n=1 Tax=Kipferlia bialata TaxID=797122 RepID=A0A9K3CRC7_9EUKA|nr:hypothetical protein KIPB_002377 [Kipferlia bialata]|eukprot:g2377.t1